MYCKNVNCKHNDKKTYYCALLELEEIGIDENGACSEYVEEPVEMVKPFTEEFHGIWAHCGSCGAVCGLDDNYCCGCGKKLIRTKV